jgi:uncharacterized membrane protein YhhN
MSPNNPALDAGLISFLETHVCASGAMSAQHNTAIKRKLQSVDLIHVLTA